jgi:hypothetical protein
VLADGRDEVRDLADIGIDRLVVERRTFDADLAVAVRMTLPSLPWTSRRGTESKRTDVVISAVAPDSNSSAIIAVSSCGPCQRRRVIRLSTRATSPAAGRRIQRARSRACVPTPARPHQRPTSRSARQLLASGAA